VDRSANMPKGRKEEFRTETGAGGSKVVIRKGSSTDKEYLKNKQEYRRKYKEAGERLTAKGKSGFNDKTDRGSANASKKMGNMMAASMVGYSAERKARKANAGASVSPDRQRKK